MEAGKKKEKERVHTVLLGHHFQSHVLLFEFLIGLLQVTDVVNGLSQHSRLVEL